MRKKQLSSFAFAVATGLALIAAPQDGTSLQPTRTSPHLCSKTDSSSREPVTVTDIQQHGPAIGSQDRCVT